MFNLIKKHYIAIVLTLIIGCLTSLPQIFAAKKVDNFQGIYKIINSDEQYYMARAKDIVDGHSFLSNPYLYEHKRGYPMQFWLPDYLLAKPIALLHINIHYGYIFYDFLLPFILALLTYSIIYLLTRSKYLSLLGTVFLHMAIFLWEFNRAPSPQLIFIFWLLLLLFWLKFLQKSNFTNTVAMGIIFGFLFHIYPYYWTFYIIVFTLFFGFNFLLKKQIEYKKYIIIFFIALAIAIPYFVSLVKSMQLPYYADSIARVGMINSHFPAGRKLVMWGVIVMFLIYFLYKKNIIHFNTKLILLTSGTIGAIIAVNQHVITGKYLQFSNHYWPLSAFWFTFTALYALSFWLKKIKKHKTKMWIITLGSIYIFYICIAPIAYALQINYNEEDIKKQNYAFLFKWLNENTLQDEVIFANSELSYLIPIYTANNVFYEGMAGLHFMSNQEFQERFTINNYWDEFDEKYIENHSYALLGAYWRSKLGHDLTKNKLRKVLFLPPKKYVRVPPEEIQKFLEFAKNIKNKDFKQQLKKYKVDYLLWDKKADPQWEIEDLDFLKFLFNIGDMSIYKIL